MGILIIILWIILGSLFATIYAVTEHAKERKNGTDDFVGSFDVLIPGIAWPLYFLGTLIMEHWWPQIKREFLEN